MSFSNLKVPTKEEANRAIAIGVVKELYRDKVLTDFQYMVILKGMDCEVIYDNDHKVLRYKLPDTDNWVNAA